MSFVLNNAKQFLFGKPRIHQLLDALNHDMKELVQRGPGPLLHPPSHSRPRYMRACLTPSDKNVKPSASLRLWCSRTWLLRNAAGRGVSKYHPGRPLSVQSWNRENLLMQRLQWMADRFAVRQLLYKCYSVHYFAPSWIFDYSPARLRKHWLHRLETRWSWLNTKQEIKSLVDHTLQCHSDNEKSNNLIRIAGLKAELAATNLLYILQSRVWQIVASLPFFQATSDTLLTAEKRLPDIFWKRIYAVAFVGAIRVHHPKTLPLLSSGRRVDHSKARLFSLPLDSINGWPLLMTCSYYGLCIHGNDHVLMKRLVQYARILYAEDETIAKLGGYDAVPDKLLNDLCLRRGLCTTFSVVEKRNALDDYYSQSRAARQAFVTFGDKAKLSEAIPLLVNIVNYWRDMTRELIYERRQFLSRKSTKTVIVAKARHSIEAANA